MKHFKCNFIMDTTMENRNDTELHYFLYQVCSILWSPEYRELISGHGFSQNQLCIWKYPSMKKVAELMGKSNVLG